MNIINVGVGEFVVASHQVILKTILGSCVGVALYSRKDKLGGLIHILLPKINNMGTNHAKYADTGIPLLINTLKQKYGVTKNNLTARIAGGSNMFPFKKMSLPMLDIGNNNIAAVKLSLEKFGIPIIEEDVGSNHGRRIEFHLDSGQFMVFGVNKQEIYK